MTIKQAAKLVSEDLGLSEHDVELVYRTYWKVIKNIFLQLPFMDGKKLYDKEQFSAVNKGVYVKHLGLFYPSYIHYSALMARTKRRESKCEGDEEVDQD